MHCGAHAHASCPYFKTGPLAARPSVALSALTLPGPCGHLLPFLLLLFVTLPVTCFLDCKALCRSFARPHIFSPRSPTLYTRVSCLRSLTSSGKTSPGNVMTFHQYIVKCHEMLPTYAGGTFQSVTRPQMLRYIVDMS